MRDLEAADADMKAEALEALRDIRQGADLAEARRRLG